MATILPPRRPAVRFASWQGTGYVVILMNVHTGSLFLPASFTWVPDDVSLWIGRPNHETGHFRPDAKVNNAWSYTSISSYAFIAYTETHYRIFNCVKLLRCKYIRVSKDPGYGRDAHRLCVTLSNTFAAYMAEYVGLCCAVKMATVTETITKDVCVCMCFMTWSA